MAWTYNTANDIGKVRHRTGDVVSGATLTLTDEEIQLELTAWTSVALAAAYCARRLAARASRMVGGGAEAADRAEIRRQYEALADALFAEAGAVPSGAWFGGCSVSERDDVDADTDAPSQPFRVGADDYA